MRVLCFLLFICGHVSAGQLHTVLICDTNADYIGTSVENDMQSIKHQTHKISEYTELALSENIFSGPDVNRQIMEHLPHLEIGPDDVVIFYFSGHGYRTTKPELFADPWPMLYFTPAAQGVSFSGIAQLLMDKKPRLMLMIADCCNNLIPSSLAPSPMPVPAGMLRNNKKEKNYTALFIESSGYYFAVGASPEQYAWATDHGGKFTNAFVKNLQRGLNQRETPTWGDIFDMTIFSVANDSQTENQTPFYQYTTDTKNFKP